MPKRTNPFQRLVTLIEHALQAGGGKVTESKELIDRVTGHRREVDIVVEIEIGTHELIIGIECTAGSSRKATVEWVERMIGKHEHLPTDKLVLVSERGFTPNAKEKAGKHGVTTYSLEEAEKQDWAYLFRNLSSIDVTLIAGPDEREIGIRPGVPSPPPLSRDQIPRSVVHNRNNEPVGMLKEIADQLCKAKELQELVSKTLVPGAV